MTRLRQTSVYANLYTQTNNVTQTGTTSSSPLH